MISFDRPSRYDAPAATPAVTLRDRWRSRRRDRRGATAVLVAVAMVPLIGIGALAIDVAWWQVGATQLQTAADAAALAAARGAQLFPTNAQSMATTYAVDLAGRNVAFGNAVTLGNAAIEPVRYTPPTATTPEGTIVSAVWSGTGTRYNAVRVTVQGQPTAHILAGVTGVARPTVQRSAVAWIANINSGCIKPFALPYHILYNKSASLAGMPTSTAASPPDLDQRQLTAVANATASQRVVIFRGPTTDSSRALGPVVSGTTTRMGNDGLFAAYSFTGNAGGTGYRGSINTCQNVSTTVDGGTTLPGNNDLECHTILGLTNSTSQNCNGTWPAGDNGGTGPTCTYKAAVGTAWDAGCYVRADTASAGRPLRVAWGDNIGNGSNAVNYRVVGEFVLLCAFRGVAWREQGQTLEPTGQTETCNTGQTIPPSNYPRGTIVGIIQGLSHPEIRPGMELGNEAGDLQRLILVR